MSQEQSELPLGLHFDDETTLQLQALTSNAIIEFLARDLTTTVKQALKSATIALCGLEENFGRYTCTHGAIKTLLEHKLKERIDKYQEKIVTEVMDRLENDEQLLRRFADQFLEGIERQLDSCCYTATKDIGQQLSGVIGNLLHDSIQAKNPPVSLVGSTNPADPNSYQGKLGRMMLRAIATNAMARINSTKE